MTDSFLPRLTFLGTGYLGATYAICFAELGYEVMGFDVDEAKVAKLAAGQVPFYEEGLDELVAAHAPAGIAAEVAWSPEFLQEGNAVQDVLRPNRIVVGVKSAWADELLGRAHRGVFDLAAAENREVPVVTTDFATAE